MSSTLWFDNPRMLIRNELRNFLRSTDPQTASGQTGSRQVTGVFPPVNIFDDGEGFRLRAEMPGVDTEQLDVSVKSDRIVIRGTRTVEDVDDTANYHRRERNGGQFRRAVSLPEPVDADNIQATYERGILNLFAPRSEKAQPRKIEVT